MASFGSAVAAAAGPAAARPEIEEGRGVTVEDGLDHLWLDLTHLGAEKINHRLPLIREVCMKFVGLDPISMGVIVRLVRCMNDALGITSIIVSHDIQEVSTVADCSFLIADGKVAAGGSPEELSNTSSELVRQFMHGMADGPVAFHYDAPSYEEQLLGRDT